MCCVAVYVVDAIPRDGRQLTVSKYKSILICIKSIEHPTVQRRRRPSPIAMVATPATLVTPSSSISPAAAVALRAQKPATAAGDKIRFDYHDGDTIQATVFRIRGDHMTVTFTTNMGRETWMNLGYPAPTLQLSTDWWPVVAGAAAPDSAAEPAAAAERATVPLLPPPPPAAGEMTPAVPPNAEVAKAPTTTAATPSQISTLPGTADAPAAGRSSLSREDLARIEQNKAIALARLGKRAARLAQHASTGSENATTASATSMLDPTPDQPEDQPAAITEPEPNASDKISFAGNSDEVEKKKLEETAKESSSDMSVDEAKIDGSSVAGTEDAASESAICIAADADATPAEATTTARREVMSQLFAQAQAEKRKRCAAPEDQLHELAPAAPAASSPGGGTAGDGQPGSAAPLQATAAAAQQHAQ